MFCVLEMYDSFDVGKRVSANYLVMLPTDITNKLLSLNLLLIPRKSD